MITDITNPEAPFPIAWTSAVGDDGAAVVFHYRWASNLWDPGPPSVGIALVHRDGTYKIIVYPNDPRFSNEFPKRAWVSDTTVAWMSETVSCDGGYCDSGAPYTLRFWNRESGKVSDAITTVTEGELAGELISLADTVLVGDILYWNQPDIVLAANSDGRVWAALDLDRWWFRMGLDSCSSTVDHPVVWVLEEIFLEDSSEFIFWQVDNDDQGDLHLIDDSEMPLDMLVDHFSDISAERCGNDVLMLVHGNGQTEIDDSDAYTAVVFSADDLPNSVSLNLDPLQTNYGTRSLTPTWVAIGGGLLSSQPDWIVHRPSGISASISEDRFCGDLEIHGNFASWQVFRTGDALDVQQQSLAARCDTYIGVLTAPED